MSLVMAVCYFVYIKSFAPWFIVVCTHLVVISLLFHIGHQKVDVNDATSIALFASSVASFNHCGNYKIGMVITIDEVESIPASDKTIIHLAVHKVFSN